MPLEREYQKQEPNLKNSLFRLLNAFHHASLKLVKDDGIEHAGYMSFMVLLAIFPFTVFFLALTSFFGASKYGINILEILLNNLPKEVIATLSQPIYNLIQAPPLSLMNLAIIGSIWTASSFVEGLRTILNKAYNLDSTPPYIMRRILSIIQFLILSGIMFLATIVFIIIPVVIEEYVTFTNSFFYGLTIIDQLNNSLITLFLLIITSLMYYLIPNTKISFFETLPGTVITVGIWIISGTIVLKYLVYYYEMNIIYGSLGGIIILLLFFYIVNLGFIYGAEFNYIYFRKKAPDPECD